MAGYVARALVAGLGLAAIAWGVYVLPIAWRQTAVERTAQQIVAGRSFAPGSLAGMVPLIESIEHASACRPQAAQAGAVVLVRLVEEAARAGDQAKVNATLPMLRDAIRSSLACSPSDPFLWLVLYWVDSVREDAGARPFDDLRMSYRLGPNEGWIAVKRNVAAVAALDRLPPDLVNLVADEFAKIVSANFYTEATEILTGPGWKHRDLLLARLKDLPERTRFDFANALYARGYDAQVPGIDTSTWGRPTDARPAR